MNQFRILFAAILVFGLQACKDEPVTETPTETNNSTEQFAQKVFVEKVASVNCGSCPLAQWELEQLKDSLKNDLIYVSNYLFGPLNHSHSDYILEKTNKTYFTPLALINRNEEGEGTVFYQLYAWEDQMASVLAQTPQLGIALNTSYSSNKAQLEVLLSRKDLLGTDNRLHVFILEKNVVGEGDGYDQRNYGNDDPEHPYYQRGEYIEGFQHKNILRALVTAKDGYEIEWRENDISISLTAEFALASGKTMEDYRVVAFVAEGEIPSAGKILNAQQVTLGEAVSMFE